ncbi:LPXTG cell wall anchor domain-containing protein [Ignavigranum ruoffiae]|uniref:LPXTG cell wall anchor domain-containing protein n=1 Tax=Ignavigranum ruoffiae TaxID=89093 RepID=UPI000B886788|nr:LPXTG cell wall anchor domain-containing protein [Ignavigranum ruoffiae]
MPETEVPELEHPTSEALESVEQPQAVQEAGVLPATGEAKQNLVWFGASATILAGLGLLTYQSDKKKTR